MATDILRVLRVTCKGTARAAAEFDRRRKITIRNKTRSRMKIRIGNTPLPRQSGPNLPPALAHNHLHNLTLHLNRSFAVGPLGSANRLTNLPRTYKKNRPRERSIAGLSLGQSGSNSLSRRNLRCRAELELWSELRRQIDRIGRELRRSRASVTQRMNPDLTATASCRPATCCRLA